MMQIQKKGTSDAKLTYDDFEVVTGDDSISVLDPFDGGSRRPRNLALKDDVHGLVGVDVGRPLGELRRNCGARRERGGQGTSKRKTAFFISCQSSVELTKQLVTAKGANKR